MIHIQARGIHGLPGSRFGRDITAGIGCIDCKKVLIAHVMELMEPIWERRNELLGNPSLIREAVDKGTERATKAARKTMASVRERMGLTYGR